MSAVVPEPAAMTPAVPDVLELRRRPGPEVWRAIALFAVGAVSGAGMCLPSLYLLLTQDLGVDLQVQASLTALLGALVAEAAILRIARLLLLLNRRVNLVLDHHGVHARNGSLADAESWTRLAWADVAEVETGTGVFGMPLALCPRELLIVRFVEVPGATARIDRLTGFDRMRSGTLGLPPLAACLTLALPHHSLDKWDRIRDWLEVHQPGLPHRDLDVE